MQLSAGARIYTLYAPLLGARFESLSTATAVDERKESDDEAFLETASGSSRPLYRYIPTDTIKIYFNKCNTRVTKTSCCCCCCDDNIFWPGGFVRARAQWHTWSLMFSVIVYTAVCFFSHSEQIVIHVAKIGTVRFTVTVLTVLGRT